MVKRIKQNEEFKEQYMFESLALQDERRAQAVEAAVLIVKKYGATPLEAAKDLKITEKEVLKALEKEKQEA